MLNNRSNIIVASIIAFFCFLSLGYMSCTRNDGFTGCEGVVCENSGYCDVDANSHKPVCHCPIGWEGANCATASVDKYIANWNMTQTITYSDSLSDSGRVSNYTAYLQRTATPTTFFINNFFDSSYYNNIVCTLDSNNSYNFTIDTTSDFHMTYDHYHILYGYGSISGDQTTITAQLAIRFKNKTTNWQVDSIKFKMVRQ